MHKTRLRLAAALLPALLLAAACSGSSDSSDADKTKDKASASASDRTADGGSATTLTKAQLTKALIATGDVPGYTVQVSQTDDSADTSTLTADKPECQPLADVTSSKPKIPRKAFVGAAFAKTPADSTATPALINQMLLASHAPGDAQKVIDSVKTALGACTSFTATADTGTKTPFTIDKQTATTPGEATASYVMSDAKDKKAGAALVTVVKNGDTITAYISVKSAGGPGVLPADVVAKQNEKLKAAFSGS